MPLGGNIIYCVAVFWVASGLALAGCGPEDEVVQQQEIPSIEVGKVDPDEIEHVPQAPKFTGEPKDVALAVDGFVKAFNEQDGKYICTEGYTKADIEVLDKDGTCVKGFVRAAKAFDGYQLQVQEIRVKGDEATVKAVVLTRDLGTEKDKALTRPISMTFVRENGEWRFSINAKQMIEDQQQQGGVTQPPADAESK